MKRPPSQLHVQLDATGVAWVRLGAPSVGAALAAALCEAAAALEADEAVRVVVLHREGKDFCRGAARGSTWWETSDCVQAIGALSTPVN